MMPYREVDLKTYGRANNFAFYQSFENPYLSVEEELDLTAFRKAQKFWGDPFFLSFNYCVNHAANQIREFRMRIVDGRLVEYDHCISSHTVLLPDDSFTFCETDATLPFDEYLKDGKRRQEAVIASHAPPVDEDPLCLFFCSCFPWRNARVIAQPLPNPPDSNPRFMWSKLREENGKCLLPFCITLNHAVADGVHAAKMLDALDGQLAEYAKNRFGTR